MFERHEIRLHNISKNADIKTSRDSLGTSRLAEQVGELPTLAYVPQ